MVETWWFVLFLDTDRIVDELFVILNSMEENTSIQDTIVEEKNQQEEVVEIKQQDNVVAEEEYNPSAVHIEEEKKEEANSENKVTVFHGFHWLAQIKLFSLAL